MRKTVNFATSQTFPYKVNAFFFHCFATFFVKVFMLIQSVQYSTGK